MKFDWDVVDFLVAGVMLSISGLLIRWVARAVGNRYARMVVVGVVVLITLWIWAELAVGIFTDWGD